MPELGIGIVGGGYMGKAHAVAFSAVGAVFDATLRPRLEMVAASSSEAAERYRKQYGFRRAVADWRELVDDDRVEAVVIATPQSLHRDIACAALSLGKPVLCEKPLGASLADSRAMVAAAETSGAVNMMGFNYIRTPASQFARELLLNGRIGDVTCFRAEHAEDFLADPDAPATWRTQGLANGTMGDLSPHIINAAHRLMGPIAQVVGLVETVHAERSGQSVTNDDQALMMVRFESGVAGSIFVSRVATGRKMGYAYQIDGTRGAIRFDGEDQNALWLYSAEGPDSERGFRKILTGPDHPDYLPFCQGPGHGTGFQDQVIIEAKDFLAAIAQGESLWPDFREGLQVNRVIAAVHASHVERCWKDVNDF